MNIRRIIAGVTVAVVVMPAFAVAQSTDTQAQIQSLMSQIQTLQKQLMALIGSSGSFKPMGDTGSMNGIVSGTISAVGASSITVQNKDGSKSVVVNFTASTTISVLNASSSQWAAGTTADLVVGKGVAVQGTQNSDGSVNATAIKVGVVAAIVGEVKNHVPPGQVGKAMCIALNRDLHAGSSGEDVKQFQQMLAQDPSSGFTGEPTGFFGPMTAKSAKHWQQNMGITPASSGAVGPQTRALMARRCGVGLGNGSMPGVLRSGTVVGTITANNGSSITLANKEGSKNATVNITTSTTIDVVSTSSPATTGSASDLVVGKMAMVQGTSNGDGTYTAIHIRVGMIVPPPPPPGGNGSASDGDQGGDDGGHSGSN